MRNVRLTWHAQNLTAVNYNVHAYHMSGGDSRWQNSVHKSYIFKDVSFFFLNPVSWYLVFHVANHFFLYHLELRVRNSVLSVIFHSDQAPALSIKVKANGPRCLSLLSLQSCVCWMKGSSQILWSEGSRNEIWHLSVVWEGVCLKVSPEGTTTGSLVSLWRESQSKQQCTYASIDMELPCL